MTLAEGNDDEIAHMPHSHRSGFAGDLVGDPLAMWFVMRLLSATQGRSGDLLDTVPFSVGEGPPLSRVGRLFAKDPLESGEEISHDVRQQVHCAECLLLPRRMRKLYPENITNAQGPAQSVRGKLLPCGHSDRRLPMLFEEGMHRIERSFGLFRLSNIIMTKKSRKTVRQSACAYRVTPLNRVMRTNSRREKRGPCCAGQPSEWWCNNHGASVSMRSCSCGLIDSYATLQLTQTGNFRKFEGVEKKGS